MREIKKKPSVPENGLGHYTHPTLDVVTVIIEKGFADSAPGGRDGGSVPGFDEDTW